MLKYIQEIIWIKKLLKLKLGTKYNYGSDIMAIFQDKKIIRKEILDKRNNIDLVNIVLKINDSYEYIDEII